MFCENPESDFTRNRKISFHDYIQLMLQMQKSAFTQQRYKLLPEGWSFLFHSFVEQCHTKKTLGEPNNYTILQSATDFDFFNEYYTEYDIEF